MSKLSVEARAIVDAARAGEDPSAQRRAQLRNQVMLGVAAAGGVSGASAVAHAKGAAATGNLVWKLTASVVVMGAVGAGAGAMMNALDEPPPPQATATNTVPSAATTSAQVVAPTAVTSSAPPTAPKTTPPSRAAAPRNRSSLAQETELLAEAQRALQTGQADRALELLDQHEDEHAHGVLEEERSAARVLALCQMQKRDEAHAAAARFLARYPSSPHASRVRRCPRRIADKVDKE